MLSLMVLRMVCANPEPPRSSIWEAHFFGSSVFELVAQFCGCWILEQLHFRAAEKPSFQASACKGICWQ